jgi:hypothetical protein
MTSVIGSTGLVATLRHFNCRRRMEGEKQQLLLINRGVIELKSNDPNIENLGRLRYMT